MQISLKWINELVNIESISLDDLIDKLTLGGFEVEEIIKLEIENQTQLALDISATANRSDSLSIQGLASEISTLLNQPLKTSNYSSSISNWKKELINFSTTLSANAKCSTIITVIIDDLTDLTVPKWMKQKLISSGFTPADNLLDFQNYILLETGYPFAFYDFDKICQKLNSSDFSLSLSYGTEKQQFIAINDLKYELNSSNLILKANDLPISIAGIIENKDYHYSDKTTSLLVEGSIFHAATIRQQSRNLGLRTERSAKYEKSLKPAYLVESLFRLLSLLRIANPNLTCKLHTVALSTQELIKPILLRYQVVNEILGPIKESTNDKSKYITTDVINQYLTRLNFTYTYDELNQIWNVEIPESRTDDITREIDLVEEIGRLHGFNNFLTTLPKLKIIGNEDPSYQTRKKLTSCLINLGLNELIHYSLVDEYTFLENKIKLVNPLLSDCSSLRSSLLPNLIKTVQENLKQGNLLLEGFEYGHIFTGNIQEDFIEKEYVSGIFGGFKTKLNWSDAEISLSWFEAKGKIEQLFKQLNFLTYWKTFVSDNNQILHPYRSAEIYLIDGKKLGIFGQIHPILANQVNLSRDIYLFEFDVKVIQDQLQKNKLTISKEYSLYPKIVKDLSFIIQETISFEELHQTLYCNGSQFLSDIRLLDEYKGKSIPDKHKSLCLQLVFQSNKTTLENKKIETIINNLELILTNKFKALIRN